MNRPIRFSWANLKTYLRGWVRPRRDFQHLIGVHAQMVHQGVQTLVARMDDETAFQGYTQVSDLEGQADEARRQISVALSDAFITPLDPEDIESLSEQMDDLIDSAKRIAGELDALNAVGDDAARQMAYQFLDGTASLCTAYQAIIHDPHAAAAAALQGKQTERTMEHIYRDTMRDLFAEQDLRDILRRQEVYRMLRDAGNQVAAAADLVRHITSKYK